MPSAMPSSMSYYKDKSRSHGNGWEDLESQARTPSPEKANIAETSRDMETGSKVEWPGDGEVHAIGDSMLHHPEYPRGR